MRLIKYDSYDEYKKAQVRWNLKKLKRVFSKPSELNAIIKYIKNNNIDIKTGVCHGVRNGWEVQYFRENLCENIFGTEISHTADQFDNVIEWDFHEIKDEWLNHFDMIYSNSFDHTYKPEECLATWMSTLSENGRLFLQWTKYNSAKHAGMHDPFGASKKEYAAMIRKNFDIESAIKVPSRRKTVMFVIKRRS
jgi:hypothetical protein